MSRKQAAPYKPYQVPLHLYQKLEEKAKEVRMQTGASITWTGVLRKILDAYFTEPKKIIK